MERWPRIWPNHLPTEQGVARTCIIMWPTAAERTSLKTTKTAAGWDCLSWPINFWVASSNMLRRFARFSRQRSTVINVYRSGKDFTARDLVSPGHLLLSVTGAIIALKCSAFAVPAILRTGQFQRGVIP